VPFTPLTVTSRPRRLRLPPGDLPAGRCYIRTRRIQKELNIRS
jgi:hypothetical protein